MTRLSELYGKTNKQNDHDIGKEFDLICGTSTGAILSCGLAAGIPIDVLKNIYIRDGKKIFPDPMPEPKRIKFYLWGLRHAFINSGNKEQVISSLKLCFGEKTLSDIYSDRQIALCIGAVDALNFRPKIFRTPHNSSGVKDGAYKAFEVVLSSSSAPLLFPINKVYSSVNQKNEYYTDGGLWINNPVMLGLTEALSMVKDNEVPIEIISVGTCNRLIGKEEDYKSPGWGILRWTSGMRIMEMLLSSQAFGYSSMAKYLADYLTGIGRKVKVIRLHELPKSPEDFAAIHVDSANRKAIKTQVSLAERDALYIFDNTKGEERQILEDIFGN